MKTNQLLFILLLVSIKVNGQRLFTDENIEISYSIKNTGKITKCIYPKQDSYESKSIQIWKIELVLKNKSQYILKAKNSNIAQITIANDAIPHCSLDNSVRNSLPNSNETDNFTWLFLRKNGNITIDANQTIKAFLYHLCFIDSKPSLDNWKFGGYNIVKKKENQDDFWNGGKSNKETKQKNNKDFWSGKGSHKEEDYFKHNTKPKESNQFIGEINNNTKYIRIVCKDHGSEDGDRVTLLKNKSIIESNIYLTNDPITFKIQLSWGMNRIDFKALNQGSTGPNTAKFEVYDDTGKLISTKEWNLLTGFTGTLLITKF